ncbi:MAG: hypothetical protein H7A24_14915 [Leptospiraceae bacterium]|nr:hypothetical protein [Leptospiraceae bacterium]MCP5513175.1 hypothetical protein [Leptospiraceae bacterium]
MEIIAKSITQTQDKVSQVRLNQETGKDSEKKYTEEEDKVENLNFTNRIQSRYILLQNKLNTLQGEYTKEQMRINIIQTGKLADKETFKILYGNSPLFEETPDEIIQDKEVILERIRSQKEKINDQIKAIEIESENVLNVKKITNPNQVNLEDLNEDSFEDLDSKSVAKLIID